MHTYLEVWKPDGPELVPLEGERLALGRAGENDVAVPGDPETSRLHAVLERFPAGWCVRDLGSRNGTFVNGNRIAGEVALRRGDEIRIGRTRIVFKEDVPHSKPEATVGADPPPELTPRERDVLMALFRPAVEDGGSKELFTEPASTKAVADDLGVSEAAIKAHLLNLYDKFEIYGEGERRRVRLANEALRRGAVNLAEIRDAGTDDRRRT